MAMNFHDARNRMSYTTRCVDESWLTCIQKHVHLTGKHAADVGCGGGIYAKGLIEAGAAHVTAVDFSEEMLQGAARNCQGISAINFVHGNAYATGLPSGQFDVLLERALIHHLDRLEEAFQEASRILTSKGIFIIQDRTPEDCLLPGDASHIRGYLFEKYPDLAKVETGRRHEAGKVRAALEANDFKILGEVKLWETREIYPNTEALSQDLLKRTGRSILHQLQDHELQELVDYIQSKLNLQAPIIEKDRWTIWFCENNG
ncbi:class I SAM-dependent methyltransferase [Paenibacillus aestuarii]|uniref:Class I SAM-dependent methyltransferase n=1 Tax=Paenibacillus aestuarii TaxID=516965 RepID=A0ABW0KEW8_9BACL|nr:class I SAM-dependent methyltransferase [Paenibacillus aestuarii]